MLPLCLYLLGNLVKEGFGLNELLNIRNSAKVVNVKEPEAGMWTVKVLFHKVYLCYFYVGMFINSLYLLLQLWRALLIKSYIYGSFVEVSQSHELGSMKF